MKRPSTLENPFTEPKDRNPDDAELIGKVLGMRMEIQKKGS
jgi:hypothetical protein